MTSKMKNLRKLLKFLRKMNCVKSVRIRSYSGPYSVRMQENTDQNISEYGHLLRSDGNNFKLKEMLFNKGVFNTIQDGGKVEGKKLKSL